MLANWGATSDDIARDGRSFIQIAEYFNQQAILKAFLEKGKYRGKVQKCGSMCILTIKTSLIDHPHDFTTSLR